MGPLCRSMLFFELRPSFNKTYSDKPAKNETV
jgi:hypothetical protein